jgi:hypothetical protein
MDTTECFIRVTIINDEMIAKITPKMRFSFQKKPKGIGGTLKIYNVVDGKMDLYQIIDHHFPVSKFIDTANALQSHYCGLLNVTPTSQQPLTTRL